MGFEPPCISGADNSLATSAFLAITKRGARGNIEVGVEIEYTTILTWVKWGLKIQPTISANRAESARFSVAEGIAARKDWL